MPKNRPPKSRNRPPHILFLCVDNAVRGQIAEGMARALFGARAVVQSAGIKPTVVHPMAVQVMMATYIDISNQYAKSVDSIDPGEVDIVITLCEQNLCPDAFPNAKRFRWPVTDPTRESAKVAREPVERFNATREEIRRLLRDSDAELTWSVPSSYLNWHASIEGFPCTYKSEVPLYSDAMRLRGRLEVNLGPYRLQHGSPANEHDPAFILSVDSCFTGGDMLPMNATNTDGFTGSWLGDEIAALCSLETGVRLMAGAQTRTLHSGEQWSISGDKQRPTFFAVRPGQRAVLPMLARRDEIAIDLLPTFPRLSSNAATALVRAARSYRDALWIAESEPELSWLLFVSAMEVAAVHQQVQISAIDVLRDAKPELAAQLDEKAFAAVAVSFERELSATKRFVSLGTQFMPEPPDKRPPEGYRLDWSHPALENRLKKVYRLRSRALHEGMPFPPPMCSPPDSAATGDVWSESIGGLASATRGAAWMKEDLPFSLHMFEHVTRGVLLNWWRSLVPAAECRGQSSTSVSESD